MTNVLLSGGKPNRRDGPPESDQSELLTDPVFLQMITWRINSLENVLLEVDAVEDSTRQILELLENSMPAD